MKIFFTNQFFKSASILLMLICSLSLKAQVYNNLLHLKLPVKDDKNGDQHTKYILCDNKVFLITRKASKKDKKGYSATYLSYDITNGEKNQIKLISDSPIFEHLSLDNLNQCIGIDILFLRVNEYERQNSKTYSSTLYLFKKENGQTYRQFDLLTNFQQFEGIIYQLDENKVVFYKNYDSHPLEDTIPTITSVYNFYLKSFEAIKPETFKGIYVTNLVGNLIAVNKDKIYRVYPEDQWITVSDFMLNNIDTLNVPINGNYSDQYANIQKVKEMHLPKKEFIAKAKPIDYFVERIESVFFLNQNTLCVVIKPQKVANFNERRLLYYSITDKRLLGDITFDYSKLRNNSSENIVPNLTYNDPFVLFNEKTNSLIYISKNQYLKGNKIKGSDRYNLNVLNFEFISSTKLTDTQIKKKDTILSNNLIFNLKGDTIDISKLFIKQSVVLVQNQRICLPCNSQAYALINSQFPKDNKYVLAEYNENLMSLLLQEKRLKKLMKIKDVYYFKNTSSPLNVVGFGNINLAFTPSPFILRSNKSIQIFYIPLNEISKE